MLYVSEGGILKLTEMEKDINKNTKQVGTEKHIREDPKIGFLHFVFSTIFSFIMFMVNVGTIFQYWKWIKMR